MERNCFSRRPAVSEERRGPSARGKDRAFRGVRMRKWGKWVAEIREPNKRSRIWLGSYSSPVAAARAYDTAVYLLRGRSALLNFPDELAADDSGDALTALSAASIRKKAAEVGARVDALQQQQQQSLPPPLLPPPLLPPPRLSPPRPRPDLNEQPSPEIAEEEVIFSAVVA